MTSFAGENNGMWGKHHTDESKRKMSEKKKGVKCDPDVVARRSEKLKGIVREKKKCPYCDKEVAHNVYDRWHGDNCKLNPLADLTERNKLSAFMRTNNPMQNPDVSSKSKGEKHWTNAQPEKVLRGDKHWMNTNPEAKEKFIQDRKNEK